MAKSHVVKFLVDRAPNLTTGDLVGPAKGRDVDINQSCAAGRSVADKATRETQWLEENREAIASYNKYIEENGLILEGYRLF